MTQKDKGKNIFQAAVDAISNRDEKAAVEEAMKRAQELEAQSTENSRKLMAAEQRANQATLKLAEAEKKIAQLTADLTKSQNELTSVRQAMSVIKNSNASMEQRLAATQAELQKYVGAEQAKVAAAAQSIGDHTVKADDTLSHIAQKFYGSAGEAYWRLIYNANKDVIGDNPGRIRPGMVLRIPPLPEELKKK